MVWSTGCQVVNNVEIQDLTLLPDIPSFRRLTRALAMLDAAGRRLDQHALASFDPHRIGGQQVHDDLHVARVADLQEWRTRRHHGFTLNWSAPSCCFPVHMALS